MTLEFAPIGQAWIEDSVASSQASHDVFALLFGRVFRPSSEPFGVYPSAHSVRSGELERHAKIDEFMAARSALFDSSGYARYASKDALFLAVVESLQGRMLSAVSATGSLPIRDRLQQIARELLDLVLDPSSLSLSRIALGASYRFPTLGHSIYGARIKKLHAVLADILEQAAKDGCLAVNNPTMAAEQFLAFVRGELHLHCLYDPSFKPSRIKIERQIEAGLDCFMARYGTSALSF